MANIAVEKVTEKGVESPSIINKLEALADRIRTRAYDIFQHRETGNEVDDWLQAERDLVFAPESELIEKDGKFEIKIAAPGFKSEETTVTVFPDAVVISAESRHNHDETDGDVHFCEFGQRALYRRLNLPKPINVDKVTAHLEDGILRISAQKAESLALVKPVKAAAA